MYITEENVLIHFSYVHISIIFITKKFFSITQCKKKDFLFALLLMNYEKLTNHTHKPK